MTAHATDLAVRRHERYLCDFPASITVSGPAVTLAKAALGHQGKLQARLVDVSRGGMGLAAQTYLPSSCRITISVTVPDGSGKERTISATAKVHRSAMTDRKPTYYIGAAFDGDDSARDGAVEKFIQMLRDSGAQRVPERGRA
jgi:hypothetical protein